MGFSYSLKQFIPFYIISLIHFYYCYTMELFQKGISKVLLMPAIVFGYYFTTKKVNIKIIIIFFFHWWGDVFFLWDSTYYFAVFGFWAGDIINCFEYYKNLKNFKKIYFIIALIITAPGVIYYGSFMFIKHVEIIMVYIFYGYIIPLASMVVLSIMVFLEEKNSTNLFFMIGNMLFIFSDLSVIWVSFANRYELDSLIIMVTYIIAQLAIINWYLSKENYVKDKIKKYY